MDRNPVAGDDVFFPSAVATREGGVDRNENGFEINARREAVATREGGVDRNLMVAMPCDTALRRHPRGWRG